jgi:hypothetical protein
VLSDEGNAEFQLMSRFVSEIANVLQLVPDTLRLRSLDDDVNHCSIELIRPCSPAQAHLFR